MFLSGCHGLYVTVIGQALKREVSVWSLINNVPLHSIYKEIKWFYWWIHVVFTGNRPLGTRTKRTRPTLIADNTSRKNILRHRAVMQQSLIYSDCGFVCLVNIS